MFKLSMFIVNIKSYIFLVKPIVNSVVNIINNIILYNINNVIFLNGLCIVTYYTSCFFVCPFVYVYFHDYSVYFF